jgi:hypothetical protein
MDTLFSGARIFGLIPRAALSFVLVLAVSGLFSTSLFAQKKYSRSYPATRGLSLQLKNWSGSIVIQGCECSEVRITAIIESRGTKLNPELVNGTLVVDVMRDNQGTDDAGWVTLNIRIPASAMVDVDTKVGDIKISDLNARSIRAHVATEGDIQLINVNSGSISADNKKGTIVFDGEFQRGGVYRFTSVDGDINIRIPAFSTFSLEATAPSSRNIALGSFASAALTSIGGGRKIVGNVGDGQATVSVMNFRGRIAFLPR